MYYIHNTCKYVTIQFVGYYNNTTRQVYTTVGIYHHFEHIIGVFSYCLHWHWVIIRCLTNYSNIPVLNYICIYIVYTAE